VNKTNIEWVKNPDGTQGYTWNPITGCLNDCEYCYARKLANGRLRARYRANENLAPTPKDLINYSFDPFYPRFWEDRLHKLVLFGGYKERGIFVCDMGELFGDWIPEAWQKKIFAAIKCYPQHRFYLLTKQPQNLIKFSPFPDNCWVGVSVCNDKMLDVAVDKLEDTQAKVKFISFEPLQKRLTLSLDYAFHYSGISWAIIGAQTKPYKPPKMTWIDEIVRACDKAGISVFEKNNLMPLVEQAFGREIYQSLILTPDGDLRQEMPYIH